MRTIKVFSKIFLIGILTMAFNTVIYGAGWVEEGGYWWYQNPDGSYACNGFQFINGRQYHFDASGHLMVEGSSQGNAVDEAIYKAYIAQNFDNESIRVALADLTHNGHDELVIVHFSSADFDPWVIVYTIEQNQVKELFRQQCSFRNEFYLTVQDGVAYFTNKVIGVYQGEGNLTYTIFSWNSDGTKNVVEEYSVDVIYDTGDGEQKEEEFNKKFNDIKSGSTIVISDYKSSLWPVSSVLMR